MRTIQHFMKDQALFDRLTSAEKPIAFLNRYATELSMLTVAISILSPYG